MKKLVVRGNEIDQGSLLLVVYVGVSRRLAVRAPLRVWKGSDIKVDQNALRCCLSWKNLLGTPELGLHTKPSTPDLLTLNTQVPHP